MNIDERNILIISLDIISEIRTLFYEILNMYSLRQFHYAENFLIYNKILQINNKENKIETEPEKLLEKLETNLSHLNSVLKFFNFNSNNKILSYNNINSFISNEASKLISNMNLISAMYYISNDNYIYFDNDFFHELKKKQILIKKYFKNMKINYFQKNNNGIEYYEIKIIVHNLFSLIIIIPSNLSKFYLHDYDNKIKIIVNGLFGPNNLNFEQNQNLNNYSNFQLFKNMTMIFNNVLKQIIQKMNEAYFNFNYGKKISFYECFIQFLDFVYDYDQIFNIKCDRCSNIIKYIPKSKLFTVPVIKVQNNDDSYTQNIINDIDKENDINNSKKLFHFYHQECINSSDI